MENNLPQQQYPEGNRQPQQQGSAGDNGIFSILKNHKGLIVNIICNFVLMLVFAWVAMGAAETAHYLGIIWEMTLGAFVAMCLVNVAGSVYLLSYLQGQVTKNDSKTNMIKNQVHEKSIVEMLGRTSPLCIVAIGMLWILFIGFILVVFTMLDSVLTSGVQEFQKIQNMVVLQFGCCVAAFCLCEIAFYKCDFFSLKLARVMRTYRYAQAANTTYYEPMLEQFAERQNLAAPFSYLLIAVILFLGVELTFSYFVLTGWNPPAIPLRGINPNIAYCVLFALVFLVVWWLIIKYDEYLTRIRPWLIEDPRTFMRTLKVKLGDILFNASDEAKPQVQAVLDTATYSSTRSLHYVADYEQAIDAQVDDLARAVSKNKEKDIQKLCHSITGLLNRREDISKKRFPAIPYTMKELSFKDYLVLYFTHGGV